MNDQQLHLCAACWRRERISHNPNGPKLRIVVSKAKPKDCDLCTGIIASLKEVSTEVLLNLKGYQFDTFLIGTSLPQGLLDREDEIRSTFKVRGTASLKTHITRTLSKTITEETGKKIDHQRPDVTVLVTFGEGKTNIGITSRSIWAIATYVKLKRGLPQKSLSCRICNGLGCATCEYKGYARLSLQTIFTEWIGKKFLAEDCHFIWIGSEDENSLVNGGGRPFFVEIVNPKKRKLGSRLLQAFKLLREGRANNKKRKKVSPELPQAMEGLAELRSFRVLKSRPASIPQFKISCVVNLVRNPLTDSSDSSQIAPSQIESNFRNAMVNVHDSRKSKTVVKKVASLKVVNEGEDASRMKLFLDCEGGIPIKKFVTSDDGTVFPNLASMLKGYELDKSCPFDITDVTLLGNYPC